ncbi:MAG TPA: PilN domain-containing protein [Gemmatimonadales bacterium]|jgi:Tfp pilus assembly protein PilN
MIRINLLPGPQKKRRGGAGFNFGSATELLAKIKNPLLLGVMGGWVAGLVVIGGLWVFQARQLAVLRDDHERVEAEARRYRTLIREKRRAEGLRDSLVAEIQAIRAIDGERYVWPHILEEVTKALPDYTWLVSLQTMAATFDDLADSTAPPPIRFAIEGRTPDLSAYTRFVSQLAASPWVRNAEFGAVQSVLEDERPVQSFSVTVTFRAADSAFIRLAPIQESVR